MTEVPFDEPAPPFTMGVWVMAPTELLRRTGAFRDNKNVAILGIVLSTLMLVAFVLIGTPG
jgi:hypothetical protein